LKPIQKPSSPKKNTKMAYTSKNSILRAKRLQSFCESENLSALIFILGIDSRRNRLTEQLYFWLFHGISGNETLSSVSLPLTEEEVSWIVTPSSFSIFIGSACNDISETSSLFSRIHQISLSWPGVHLTTLTKDEVQDSELAENTKLLWFNRTMSQVLGPVGVCSSEIETWPLIQGYAIDLFGLGFFSMSHPPKDISFPISQIFLEFDDAGILAVLNEHLPRLFNVFQQTIDFVNKRNYSAGRGELREKGIGECVTLPFEYATLQSLKERMVKPEFRLFGFENTDKLHSAHHMTVQSVCGVSGIFAARTWFLIPSGGIKEFISQYQEEDDVRGLMQIYKIVSDAVQKALKVIAPVEDIKEKILLEIFKSKTLFKYHHMLEPIRKAKIDFFSHDADGITSSYNENLPIHTVLFKATALQSKDFGNFGDLVFAETFISRGGYLTNVTENIPTLVLWENQTKRPWVSAYGEKLSQVDNTLLYIEEFGSFIGTLLIFELGWAFRSIHLGQLEYFIDEFCRVEQHTAEILSFFTETVRIVVKLPRSTSFVLVSIWKIKDIDTEPPELPVVKQVIVPHLDYALDAEVFEDLIPLYFVTGVAGSGKTKAAKDLARGLKANLLAPPLEIAACFDLEFWKQALAGVNKSTVVLLPSFLSVLEFKHLIPSNCYVRSVICRVSSKNIYLNYKRKIKIPALIHLIQSCNSLIYEEGAGNDEFGKILLDINPYMEIFKISGTIGPAQARNIGNVPKRVPAQLPYHPEFKLQSVFMHIPLPLVESKIKARLANSEISDDGAIAKRISWQNDLEILRIKGCVEFYIKENEFFEISGTSKYLVSSPCEASTPGILFIGRNLDLVKLYEFVLDCRSHTNKIALKTRKGLSSSEVANIENNLPDNSEYRFDGVCYVDSEGKRFKVHPDLEQALQDYVDQENDRIGNINRAVEKEASILKKANSKTVINQVFL
jgi:hypothetical protein